MYSQIAAPDCTAVPVIDEVDGRPASGSTSTPTTVGFAALTERGKRALADIGLGGLDHPRPHKWLYQPFECGCLLVREDRRLRGALEMSAPRTATGSYGVEVSNRANWLYHQ